MTKEDQERIERDSDNHYKRVIKRTDCTKRDYIAGATHERSLMEKEKWISVKDQPPNKDEVVLLFLNNEMYIGHIQIVYSDGLIVFKETFGTGYNIRATHWQPLPEPPIKNF